MIEIHEHCLTCKTDLAISLFTDLVHCCPPIGPFQPLPSNLCPPISVLRSLSFDICLSALSAGVLIASPFCRSALLKLTLTSHFSPHINTQCVVSENTEIIPQSTFCSILSNIHRSASIQF